MAEISADSSTLMRQASMTVDVYMKEAITRIDRAFGIDYAKEHPELVGAFIQAAAMDMTGSIIAKMIEQVALEIGIMDISDIAVRLTPE
jgi:hypothetical protein